MGSKSAAGRSQTIDLGYQPRPWQNDVHRSRRRFTVAVVHRRGGKSQAAVAELVDTALRLPGAVLAYVAPTRTQARTVIWQRLKDFTRPVPGLQVYEQELKVVFPNGSCVFLAGALDGADGLRGVGLDGVVLDEFGLMADSVFPSVIRPALADRQGWAIFIGTPMGRDPLYRLIQATQGLPDWSHFTYPASTTGVLPPEELEAARRAMPEDAFAREFLCSFSAAPAGSIYGRLLSEMRTVGRLVPVPFIEGTDLLAALDLGIADATAVIIAMKAGSELRVLWAQEYTGTALVAVAQVLKDFGVHRLLLPHDAEVRELTTAQTRRQVLDRMGFSTTIVPRVSVEEGIAAATALLRHTVIDTKYAAPLIDSLENYRREVRDDGGHAAPLHDRWSHLADAFRYLALGVSARPVDYVQDEQGRVSRLHRSLVVTRSDGTRQEVKLP